MRARFISTSPPGSLMLQISVAQLYDDNRDKLGFAWIGGKAGGATKLWRDSTGVAALVGHLNLIHPNRIQVLGNHEIAHLAAFEEAELFQMLGNLFAVHPVAIVVADGAPADVRMLKAAEASGTAVFATDMPGAQVIDRLRRYLGKALAETTQCHGVCMDVLGLGVLNIRTIFGETAVRPKMNLRLIVHLDRPGTNESERLPLLEQSEDILGVTVRKVVIPVAAGRNLAVLLEAAVRNYILQLRGIHSTAEFMQRQQAEMKKD